MQYNFPFFRHRREEKNSKHFSSKLKKALKLQSIKKTSHNHEMENSFARAAPTFRVGKKRQQQKSGLCLPFGFALVIFAKENINISFRKFFTKSQPICYVVYFLCLHKRKLFLIINFTCFFFLLLNLFNFKFALCFFGIYTYNRNEEFFRKNFFLSPFFHRTELLWHIVRKCCLKWKSCKSNFSTFVNKREDEKLWHVKQTYCKKKFFFVVSHALYLGYYREW